LEYPCAESGSVSWE
jgi:hypothetical protein